MIDSMGNLLSPGSGCNSNFLSELSKPPSCIRPGCGKPAFRGQDGKFCSRSCRDGRSPSRTPGRASSRGACVGGQGQTQYLPRHEFRSQQQQQQPQQQEQAQQQGQQRHLGPSAGTGSCPQLLRPVQPIKFALTEAPGSNFYFFHCDLVAFYFPGRSAPCDEKCRADFLGNFWDLGSGRLKLTPPGSDPRYFRTAEGAYQALKFWKASEATAFEGLPGEQALKLSRHLSDKGIEMDPHFAGYGTAWQAMRAVLAAKFSKGSDMANALRKTENAFLLEHNSFTGRDDIWSDNCDGSGKNWLGLLLMLRRTELFSYSPSWLRASVDDQTGSFPNREWADKVQEAARRINLELGQVHSDSSSRLGARLRAYSRPRERAASPRAAGMPSDPLKRCDYSITSPPRCAPQSSCPAPLPASFFWYPNLPTRAGTTVIIQPSLHQFSSQ
ncbi:unnamed protein product [Polarella glacialis]|uniref:NADAR domain-containing protein n=1 Tax=Polarella glacialis TaxID=89957 RepID=A0A813KVL0_POLGL|nr:unnamed protein product [Polarella glacialis]